MVHHTRSNSYPAISHPVASEVDEVLNRLASSESTSSSSSSSSVCQKLNSLQGLHDCIKKLLLLPLNQQALAHEQNRKYVDDDCTAAKEALLLIKESTQELLSVMRRKRGTEIIYEVKKFLASRKAVKKAILKALKNLKNKENKHNETGAVFDILRQAQAVTLNVLESLLLFISGSKPNKLSVVSKLFINKRITCDEERNENEIANAQAALLSFISGKSSIRVENAQAELQKAESCIQDLQEELESTYRHLIKSRATVLNILNH